MANDFQKQFFYASNGRWPQTESEITFCDVLPSSPEDACWRHITGSAEYALRVVIALETGNKKEARRELKGFRNEGMGSRGFGKEALTKLQAGGLIEELYSGGLRVPYRESLGALHTRLEGLIRTPRPEEKP